MSIGGSNPPPCTKTYLKGNTMATMNSFNHFLEVLQMRMLEKQDILFEQGNFCECGERKYKVLVSGVVKNEACPVCEGSQRIVDLMKG